MNGDFYVEKWLEGVLVKRKLVSDDCIIGLVLLERVEISFSTKSVTYTFPPHSNLCFTDPMNKETCQPLDVRVA